MTLDIKEASDIWNLKEQKSTIDIKKNEVLRTASQNLTEMKLSISFNKDQIKSFENEISKRFKIDNNINKLLSNIEVIDSDINNLIINFQNWKYDRYYTKNLEIKEITPIIEKEITLFIENISKNKKNTDTVFTENIIWLIWDNTTEYEVNYSVNDKNNNDLYQIDDSFKS